MIVWLWLGFVVFVLGMLALDLGVLNRGGHAPSTRSALAWTGVCVGLALAFAGVVWLVYDRHLFGIGLDPDHAATGSQAAVLFLTGYLVEESLSLDNVFVIALIFTHFRVPAALQHRVLFWGILGALVLRGIMIGLGAVLLDQVAWITYVFGGILLFTAVKLMVARSETPEPEENLLVRITQRFLPLTHEYDGSRFFTVRNGRRVGTLLFLVLLVVESTDVLFAVDSIPAVFAVTTDPFLVFTSNIFAILGLRSLFFAISTVLGRFVYLKQSLVFVLGFVGIKMVLAHHVEIPALGSLGVIVGILGLGVIASVVHARRHATGGKSLFDEHPGVD